MKRRLVLSGHVLIEVCVLVSHQQELASSANVHLVLRVIFVKHVGILWKALLIMDQKRFQEKSFNAGNDSLIMLSERREYKRSEEKLHEKLKTSTNPYSVCDKTCGHND